MKTKKLDKKLKITMQYYQMLEEEIQNTAKKLLNDKNPNLSQKDYKLLADYALSELYDNWETLRNRGYSLLHEWCWKYWYGDVQTAIDPYGYTIERTKFGSGKSMWNVDHVWPFSKGGLTVIENGIPTSYDANEEKAGLTSGLINKRKFSVSSIKTDQGLIGELKIDGKFFEPKNPDNFI